MTGGAPPAGRGGRSADLPRWRLLDLGSCEPVRAQAFVESVAESVGRGDSPNTLLVARPERPYISIGFHQSLGEEIDPEFLVRRPVPVLRRVEGGGTTWLDPDQWFYQLVYRDEGGGRGGASDLARFLQAPVRVLTAAGLRAEVRLPSDVVVGARKISGNAGGDWAEAHIVVGGLLGRTDSAAMAGLMRLPHEAIRPLLHAEIARHLTSWMDETGEAPDWARVRGDLVAAYQDLGLFRAEPGRPTEEEEARFSSEVVARHRDRAWMEVAPVPRPRDRLLRRIRVAGPHGLLVLALDGSDEIAVVVVEGARATRAYLLDPAPTARLRPVEDSSARFRALRDEVVARAPFA